MVYDSSFAVGRQSTLLLQLLEDKVPSELRLVHLIINVAGNHFRTVFSALPNLTYTYAWDHKNIYTQTINGLVNAESEFFEIVVANVKT